MPSLAPLLQAAVSQSPRAIQASLEVAAADAMAMTDGAVRWPQLSASANFGFTESSTKGGISSKNDGFYYSLNLYQPLYHWGALKAQADIGKLRKEIAEMRYVEAYRVLVNSIRTQFVTLIQKKRAVGVSQERVRRAESNLEALEQRFAAGAISPAALNEPRLELAEARISRDSLEDDYSRSLRLLARLAGVETLQNADIPDTIAAPTNDLPALLEALKEPGIFDPATTPLARTYEATVQQFDLDYRIAKTRLLPKIGLSAGITQQNNTTASTSTITSVAITQQTASVMASWMIFDGFSARGSKASALAQKRRMEIERERYLADVSAEASGLWTQVGLALRALEVAEIRQNVADASVKKFRDDLAAGQQSPEALEIVTQDANNRLLRTFQARIEYYTRLADYLSLTGKDPALLNLPSRYQGNGQ